MAKIITISGPRGVGKSAIVDGLRDKHSIRPIVPYTTREPRQHEIDGRDYNFIGSREFDTIRRTVGMFDVLTLGDNKYGTPIKEFDDVIAAPDDSVDHIRTINLAAGSAIELRREMGASVVGSVFVLPRSWTDIEQQMRDGGLSEEVIMARRASEPTDLTMLPAFNHIVVNEYGRQDETCRNVAEYILNFAGLRVS